MSDENPSIMPAVANSSRGVVATTMETMIARLHEHPWNLTQAQILNLTVGQILDLCKPPPGSTIVCPHCMDQRTEVAAPKKGESVYCSKGHVIQG